MEAEAENGRETKIDDDRQMDCWITVLSVGRFFEQKAQMYPKISKFWP